jgi:mRNA-degrading endonuclease RelE of RelBE toxin-antitoxin system
VPSGGAPLPSIRFYPSFPDDWQGLPPDVRASLGKFLEHLQSDPLDPELQASTEMHPPFFAYRIAQGYVVVWTLKFSDLRGEHLAPPTSIDVLEVARIPRLEQTPNQGAASNPSSTNTG